MKEMIKSKGMILFVVAFIAITYVNAVGTARMENSTYDNKEYIALNVK